MSEYSYRVFSIDASSGLSEREYEIDGERIVYAKPSDGPELTVKLNAKGNDGIPLTPKSRIIAPFRKFFLTSPAFSASNLVLFVTKPAEISLDVQDVVVSEISNVERVTGGSTGKVNVGSSSTQVLPANASRKRVILLNVGANNVYIALGATAAVTDYMLGAQEHIILEHYTGEISGICDTGYSTSIRYLSEG